MAALGKGIERVSRVLRFRPEKREFSPHLTIARLREPAKGQDLAERHLASDFEAVRFAVNQIVLYRSELRPSGSVYSVVSRHALSSSF